LSFWGSEKRTTTRFVKAKDPAEKEKAKGFRGTVMERGGMGCQWTSEVRRTLNRGREVFEPQRGKTRKFGGQNTHRHLGVKPLGGTLLKDSLRANLRQQKENEEGGVLKGKGATL